MYVTYELNYAANFYIRMFLIAYMRGLTPRRYLALYIKSLSFVPIPQQ